MGLNFQSVAFQHLGYFSGCRVELLAELFKRHAATFYELMCNRFGKPFTEGLPIGFQNSVLVSEFFDEADRAAVMCRKLFIGTAVCDILFSDIVFVQKAAVAVGLDNPYSAISFLIA